MRRVVIFIALMLIGFTSCDSGMQPYASHFFHDGYKVMYGEYDVTSVICFPEDMPEHLIEQATEIVQKGRLLQDESKLTIKKNMTYSLKESDLVISSGRYEVGIYDVVPAIENCYYYSGHRSHLGFISLMDNNGDKMYFQMHVTAHEDKTKSYGIPWAYQQFEIAEGNRHIHYGIRYGLIYCE